VRSRWTPRRALARAGEVVRTEGWRSLALRAAGELVYRRMYLMELPFDHGARDVDPTVPVEFRPAGEPDAEEIAALLPQADPAEVRRRLRAGHECFVGVHEGAIFQCCWIGIDRARIDYLDADIVLPPRVGYLYDLYTSQDMRGLGLHRSMYPHLFRHFAPRDPVAVICSFHPENRTYLIFERLGLRHVATIGYVGIRGWRKLFYRPVSDDGARRSARRSRSRRAGTPFGLAASTRRSPGRAS
jgi:ribosomal protein S18 acetylase RimI-like enzyme